MLTPLKKNAQGCCNTVWSQSLLNVIHASLNIFCHKDPILFFKQNGLLESQNRNKVAFSRKVLKGPKIYTVPFGYYNNNKTAFIVQPLSGLRPDFGSLEWQSEVLCGHY